MILVTSPRFGGHVTPPGHPESLERAEVFDRVAARFLVRGGRTSEPRLATRSEVARVHGEAYLDRLEALSGRAAMLDDDTFTSPESIETAQLAAGATVVAVDHALDEREATVAMVRPPGHHAERDQAMGFCFYNNVAVGAAHGLSRGLSRVAIVDIDVHHGNGSQWMFYDDPRVLYVSTHQFPFYPGTGAADEVGHGEGAGFTVNVPLEAGANDADYGLVYRSIVRPVLEQFEPELVIVSAGFDAHERDPLASMRVTTEGYAGIVRGLQAWSGSAALAFVTEGGYDLGALEACLESSFAVLTGPGSTGAGMALEAPAPRGERAVAAVRAAQSPYWRGL
jgi:acetoin utilization deacetylase AcuC-like enzyme